MKALRYKLSETYIQLAQIFKALEVGSFQEGTDFGENVANSFSWYLSPPALIYLERHFTSDLERLRNNSRFSCKSLDWQGYNSHGLDIKLAI